MTRGWAISARANGQHLLLSPAEGSFHLGLSFPENGKKAEGLFIRSAIVFRSSRGVAAHEQISPTEKVGENLAALGNGADSKTGPEMGWRLSDVFPLEENGPFRHLARPITARRIVVLPAPLAPMMVTSSPSFTVKLIP